MNRWLLVLTALLLPVLAGCGQKASTREGAVTPAPVESGPVLATSESAAHCRRGETVWVNSRSHIFHLQGDPYYGHTKQGGYLCKDEALRDGYRQSKK
jgi:hypothetical protein